MKIKLSELIENISMTDEETRYVIDESNGDVLMIWGSSVDGEFEPELLERIEKGEGFTSLPLKAEIDEKVEIVLNGQEVPIDVVHELIGRKWAEYHDVIIHEDIDSGIGVLDNLEIISFEKPEDTISWTALETAIESAGAEIIECLQNEDGTLTIKIKGVEHP